MPTNSRRGPTKGSLITPTSHSKNKRFFKGNHRKLEFQVLCYKKNRVGIVQRSRHIYIGKTGGDFTVECFWLVRGRENARKNSIPTKDFKWKDIYIRTFWGVPMSSAFNINHCSYVRQPLKIIVWLNLQLFVFLILWSYIGPILMKQYVSQWYQRIFLMHAWVRSTAGSRWFFR